MGMPISVPSAHVLRSRTPSALTFSGAGSSVPPSGHFSRWSCCGTFRGRRPFVEKTIRMMFTVFVRFRLMWDLQSKFPFRHQTQIRRLGM